MNNTKNKSVSKNLTGKITVGKFFLALFCLFLVGSAAISIYLMDQASKKEQETNPAKKLASIMIPFAKTNKLALIDDYNGAAVGDNQTPFFIYLYQSNASMDELHSLIKPYLEKEGYTITEYFTKNDSSSCTVYVHDDDCQTFHGSTENDGQPYWVMEGITKEGDTVDIEISNKTYFNGANDDVVNYGEKSIPEGKIILNLLFTKDIHSQDEVKFTPEPPRNHLLK